MKMPPEGFPTWINYYDYLVAEKPELLRGRSIVFYVMKDSDEEYFTQKPQRLSIRTLKAKCWEELQEDRLTVQETHQTLFAIECQAQPYSGQKSKANNILQRLKIHGQKF